MDLTPVGLIPGPNTLTFDASNAGLILTLYGDLATGLPPNVMLTVWFPI